MDCKAATRLLGGTRRTAVATAIPAELLEAAR
jgi:hypothetical protein